MKTFKQFLLEKLLDDVELPEKKEETQTAVPLRSNFPEGDEGQSQYLQALRDAAPKIRQEAQRMTNKAESEANLLGKAETGLKAAETVTDLALSAGSVTPIGAALNAGVKAVKGGMAAAEGDYVKATTNALDAALPVAGKLATGVKGVSTAVKAVTDPLGLVASKIPSYIGIGEVGANVAGKMGLGAVGTKAASKVTEVGTSKAIAAAIDQANETEKKKQPTMRDI